MAFIIYYKCKEAVSKEVNEKGDQNNICFSVNFVCFFVNLCGKNLNHKGLRDYTQRNTELTVKYYLASFHK